ncbi:siphovirus ReqiPepy6 Gp37-like family protein [Eubacteriales bacterium OttesenSCG-928-A19]|nr:siphovirus ReqiPepy6 Gp37-like family protein [Eubacteriales bacterium OttesenSCG-928-A19]
MSSFYIYDTNRDRIGLLQHDNSVQWLEHYQANGEVKIVAQVTPDNLALLVDGNRIHNPDSGTAARISHVDLDQMETEDIITARADITSELLDDRVVMATVNITNVEAAMYALYSQNRREMPIEVGMAKGFTETDNTQITWGSVLEAEKKLAVASGLGFRVDFDAETGLETFTVYKGIDRTDDTSDDYVGYFGTDVGGIEKVTVTSGTTGFKNVAVVAGAGEGANRTVRIVSLGNVTGENRRELYVDARDLQREYQVAIPTGGYDPQGNPLYNYETRTYTDAQYNAMLDARGMEKLMEHLKTFSITCNVTQNNIVYGVDYGLGDRVPVKLPEYGIYATARFASANRIYEREGVRVVAILSEFELEEAA